MQNVSGETFDAVAVRKSLSKRSDFRSVTASPYRVLHQAQGDKQEINPIRLKSSSKTNGSTQRDDAPLPRKMGLFPVYRLEEAEGLLKEGGVWVSDGALRACSYKTKTEASQQRRSRHTLQGVFLVFLCCIPSKWTIIFDDLSHFAIFLSLLEHETPCKCPFGHLLSHIKQQTIGSNFY